MEHIAELIELLFSKNATAGCGAMKELIAVAEESNCLYPYMDRFIEMLDSDNSYIRTRGLLLIAANAKWDVDYKIDEIIDEYLRHINDSKPITARQLIQVLPKLAKDKPDLKDDILKALLRANTERYTTSMRPLVEKDIRNALEKIRC